MVNVFLIAHPAGPILVDTGVGSGSRQIDAAYAPVRGDLAARLLHHGIALTDTRIVVNTHLHFDHIGRNLLFPAASFHVQAMEVEAARERGYTVAAWLGEDARRRVLVQGDTEIGDGVTLLATPGHTAGHQSVVIESASGVEVIAGQAASSPEEYDQVLSNGLPLSIDPPAFASEYVASLRRIEALGPVRVHFSHHARAWVRAERG